MTASRCPARIPTYPDSPGSTPPSKRRLGARLRPTAGRHRTALPNAPVTIDIDSKVKLTCRRSTFTLPAASHRGITRLFRNYRRSSARCPDRICPAVAQTQIAASRNDGGQVVFTGIRLEVAGNC